MQASFYDRAYFEGGEKSNYRGYTADSSPFETHAETIARLLTYHGLSGPVLDVGCAKGYLVHALRRRDIEAFGVDLSTYAVDAADAEIRPYLWQGSACQLPFGDGRFALAVSFDLMEHLDEKHARRAMRECARVSTWQLHQVNTGRLPEWRFDSDASHCTRLPLADWRRMAEDLVLVRTVVCEPDRRLPFLDEPAPAR